MGKIKKVLDGKLVDLDKKKQQWIVVGVLALILFLSLALPIIFV